MAGLFELKLDVLRIFKGTDPVYSELDSLMFELVIVGVLGKTSGSGGQGHI